MNYLTSDAPKATPAGGCIFCAKAATRDLTGTRAELIIAHSQYVFVVLNLYPYNNGHLMVVPHEHVGSMEALSPDALTDLMLTTNRAMGALRKLYKPAAFNVGANIGAAAGAGIAAHFHLHIVPRWGGDANFMSVISDTRVIPDLLDDTWRRLYEIWHPAPGATPLA